jgi:ribosomal protein S4
MQFGNKQQRIPTAKSLQNTSNLPASAFCRRRLAVILTKLHMAESLKQATMYIEQGHIRVGITVVTDPAFLVTRSLEAHHSFVFFLACFPCPVWLRCGAAAMDKI